MNPIFKISSLVWQGLVGGGPDRTHARQDSLPAPPAYKLMLVLVSRFDSSLRPALYVLLERNATGGRSGSSRCSLRLLLGVNAVGGGGGGGDGSRGTCRSGAGGGGFGAGGGGPQWQRLRHWRARRPIRLVRRHGVGERSWVGAQAATTSCSW